MNYSYLPLTESSDCTTKIIVLFTMLLSKTAALDWSQQVLKILNDLLFE